MPKIDTGDLEFPPFLRADNIGGKLGDKTTVKVTSPHRTIQTAGQADRIAINVRTKDGIEYTLSLNKTNKKSVVDKLGDNSDDWVGEVINLVRSVANNPQTQKEVPAIRIG